MNSDDSPHGGTKMRVSFVLPVDNMAGGIRVISIYANLLTQRGHKVTLVSLPRRKATLRERLRSLVRRRKLPKSPPRVSYLDQLDLDHSVLEAHRPITDADLPDADVVIATWWETALWVKRLSPSKGKKAYFVQDYGAHAGQPLDAVAATWNYGLYMFTISAWLRDLIVEHTKHADIAIVPNSVDLDLFKAPERGKQARPTVGFLHDLRTQKGTDDILMALKGVVQAVPDLRIVCFGPDEPTEAFPPGSEFHRFARDEDLPGIYAKCDVWLFASRREGFGLPISEAMACRTPVIATPAGAAPELLKSGGGRLIPHNDIPALTATCVEILGLSDADWRTLSSRAYEAVKNYTWQDATDKLESQLRFAIVGN